jgi:hypothetical protein
MTQASGQLDSTPDITFTLDFYANTLPDPSGNGEGQTYLGSTTVITDNTGHSPAKCGASGFTGCVNSFWAFGGMQRRFSFLRSQDLAKMHLSPYSFHANGDRIAARR